MLIPPFPPNPSLDKSSCKHVNKTSVKRRSYPQSAPTLPIEKQEQWIEACKKECKDYREFQAYLNGVKAGS